MARVIVSSTIDIKDYQLMEQAIEEADTDETIASFVRFAIKIATRFAPKKFWTMKFLNAVPPEVYLYDEPEKLKNYRVEH